jgi:HTH-type transcriptional regulator / antitoxin HigA
MMKPKVIKTARDYKETMKRIEEIFEAKPRTPEGDELELLTTLVELYEKKEFPIDLPDPVSAVKFRMEQQGLKAKDLVQYIGSASKVSEVLSGKRAFSTAMMQNLVTGLDIPPAIFLGRKSKMR